MKTQVLRRAIVAGVLATSGVNGITAATPAYAQFGGIVYDPTNYAQNVLTAARSLQQINNQIQQIQNQATSLINEARNLASLPFSSLQQLQQQVQRTQQLLGEAQRIAYDVQNVQQAFTDRYKGTALTGDHEAIRDQPWRVGDAPDAYIASQIKGIVGVEIEIAEIEGKWKVSQNRPAPDIARVADALGDASEPHANVEIAALVRRYGRDK